MDKVGRWIVVAVVLGGLAPLGGCRICADCEDLAYPAYGGAWQRTRRDSGRVGSLFDPAGAQTSALVERDRPPTPDVLQRDRQRGPGVESDATDRAPGDRKDPADPDQQDDPKNNLFDRELDDIPNKKEEELRKKNLDDINVQLTPQQSRTASLR